MRKTPTFGALFLTGVLALAARAEVPDGWFVWPLAEPKAGSALDQSRLNREITGEKDRVSVKDGHFVDASGKPLRFWGANIQSYGAFQDAEGARALATLLAKNGINIARLHHLDNPWGKKDGGSIWPDQARHEDLDPVQLDKLHRLVAELKKQGIYTNLNLKVSKSLTAADGFPESVTQVDGFQKRTDMYEPKMLALQKDYARRLLTVRNPYTGLSLAEDPAVAVVELNNENSVLGYWTRDLGRGLQRQPEPFRSELQRQWNVWLKTKYGSTEKLSTAWAGQPVSPTLNLLADSGRWTKEQRLGCEAEFAKDSPAGTLDIQIKKADGVEWHIQAHRDGLSLVDGQVYTVEYDARADKARSIQVGIGIDTLASPGDEWRSMGLLETANLGIEWRRQRHVFCAHSVAGAPVRLSFNVAQNAGVLSFRSIRVYPGCEGSGVQAGERVEEGKISLPEKPSSAQWADWIAFLADTDRHLAVEMRRYLREELKVTAPMICSQIDYGGITGLWREKDMEFADSHVYWQHPVFGSAGMWDAKAWSIRNSPQISEFKDRSFGELGNMALIRVSGKPFTLSEYDHAAPTEYACEMYPVLSSFAARQDWDGVYPFAIGEVGKRDKDGAISDYFDQQHHPAKWGFSTFATRVFREKRVPAASQKAELQLGSPSWSEAHHADVLWLKHVSRTPLGFLSRQFGVRVVEGLPDNKSRLVMNGTVDQEPIQLQGKPEQRLYLVSTPTAAAIVGFIGGTESSAGILSVKTPSFGGNFAALTALTLDNLPFGESASILVTLVGRAQNQDITWNAERSSLGTQWGHGPTIVERVPATIRLKGVRSKHVYALAPDGTRKAELATRHEGEVLEFSLPSDCSSIHFELSSQP